MRDNRSREIMVGLITILALVLLLAGISLGEKISFSPGENELIMKFPTSGGIKVSEPVVVNGVQRGNVSSVENIPSGVLIKAALDDYSDIKTDASAKIMLLEITGGKKIEINPGRSNKMISPADTIFGKTPPDISELVALLGEVSGDAVSLIRTLDTMSKSANEIISDEKFIADLKSTMNNANELTGNLNTLVNDNYIKLENSLTRLENLTTNLDEAVIKHEPSVGRILGDIETLVADTRTLLNSADGTLSRADVLITDLRDISGQIKSGKGAVGKFIYDDEFAMRLDSTINGLYQFVEIIRQHGVNVNVRLGSRP
jgi:ABC-type transporter Mla subunit MlaD